MNVLSDMINLMTKEDVRHLKLYLNRTKSNADNRKDIELFDYIRKAGEKYNEEKVLKRLYQKDDKNALYRLKNRLLEEITKSLSLQYFNHIEANQALNFMAMSRLYLNQGHFGLANHFLQKAEKKANEIEAYELLDIIYSDFIRISHETLSINPELYIRKRAGNKQQLNQLREIDDILAVLIYRIKLSQNLSSENTDIVKLLQKTIDDFSRETDVRANPKLRFKIYDSLSRILLQQHNYEALEDYLKLTLKEFTDEGLFTRANHDTKLQMLTYLVNSLFKNSKFEESLDYAEELRTSMEAFNRTFHKKYLFYYYNSLVNNYSMIDKEKAISILQEAMEEPVVNKLPMNRVFIHIQMALQYFDIGEFRKANRSLVKLKFEDSFLTLDQAFQLKVGIMELIIRYEMEDYDFIEYQATRLKRSFEKLLKQHNYLRQRQMVDIILKMIYSPNVKTDTRLVRLIEKLIGSVADEAASDLDILNYNEWLQTKIVSQPG